MSTAYDNYDYTAYWEGRDYEHESEIIALKKFLNKIPKITRLADVGCGFGRLTPYYMYRAKRVVLIDPSKKLLSLVNKKFKNDKSLNADIKTVQSSIKKVPKKLKGKSFDLVMCVRVMHHLEDPEEAISSANKMLKSGGYFIVEFANKLHGKAVLQNFCRGNFTFPLDIFSIDRRSKRSKRAKKIRFQNYHPDVVKECLEKYNFKILETRSVSNIRSTKMKQYLPLNFLLQIEEVLQKPFAHFFFGPSIFVLAKKK